MLITQYHPLIPLTRQPLPLYQSRVSAGFPSAADDYIERALDLNEHLVQHPSATYYARAQGHSMVGRGIFDGDLLIVDRALTAKQDDIVIAVLQGELTCKILAIAHHCLQAANPKYPAIAIHRFSDLVIEGVVRHSIRYHP